MHSTNEHLPKNSFPFMPSLVWMLALWGAVAQHLIRLIPVSNELDSIHANDGSDWICSHAFAKYSKLFCWEELSETINQVNTNGFNGTNCENGIKQECQICYQFFIAAMSIIAVPIVALLLLLIKNCFQSLSTVSNNRYAFMAHPTLPSSQSQPLLPADMHTPLSDIKLDNLRSSRSG